MTQRREAAHAELWSSRKSRACDMVILRASAALVAPLIAMLIRQRDVLAIISQRRSLRVSSRAQA